MTLTSCASFIPCTECPWRRSDVGGLARCCKSSRMDKYGDHQTVDILLSFLFGGVLGHHQTVCHVFFGTGHLDGVQVIDGLPVDRILLVSSTPQLRFRICPLPSGSGACGAKSRPLDPTRKSETDEAFMVQPLHAHSKHARSPGTIGFRNKSSDECRILPFQMSAWQDDQARA